MRGFLRSFPQAFVSRAFGLVAPRIPATPEPEGRTAPVAAAAPAGFRVLDALRPEGEANPRLRPPLPDRLSADLRETFTPTRPRALGPLFIGRETELERMLGAMHQEHAHIVLYGARGRGKTSLANAFADLATESGCVTVRRACGAESTYERLFRGLLSGIPARLLGADTVAHAASRLPDGAFGPEDVTEALSGLRGGHVVLLIDEFDRAESPALRNALAETIKNLSDQALPVTLLVVGVAASLEDLLGRQPSIQRNIAAVHVPPMPDPDIARIIAAGAGATGFDFAPEASDAVVRLSRGMPYYAHLLCLFATRIAASRPEGEAGKRRVSAEDIDAAVAEAARKQEAELGSLLTLALALPGAEAALRAAARAPRDADDRFAADALPEALAPLLAALATPQHGPALQADAGGGNLRYTFTTPALAHQMLFREALGHARRIAA